VTLAQAVHALIGPRHSLLGGQSDPTGLPRWVRDHADEGMQSLTMGSLPLCL
jgi:hypothetical protein